MANKSKNKEINNPKLSPAQYWEWRYSVEQLKNSNLLVKQYERDVKIKELEYAISASRLNTERLKSEKVSGDYQAFVTGLEEKVGTKIRDKCINPMTFEITEVIDNDLGDK